MDFACFVMDTGTGLVKAEKCTAQVPGVFSNIVGSIKYGKEVLPVRLQGNVDGTFASSDTEAHRGLLQLSHPMENGHITDWKGMERVWQYVFDKCKCVASHHPVLLTEAPNTSRKI
jgi:centractin